MPVPQVRNTPTTAKRCTLRRGKKKKKKKKNASLTLKTKFVLFPRHVSVAFSGADVAAALQEKGFLGAHPGFMAFDVSQEGTDPLPFTSQVI